MTLNFFFNISLFCLMISGVARWVYKFVETIKSGGYTWINPLIVTAGAVTAGIWYPLYMHSAVMIPVAIGTCIAIIQFGYEIGVKPVLKLFTWISALFDYLGKKMAAKIGMESYDNLTESDKTTTESVKTGTTKAITIL